MAERPEILVIDDDAELCELLGELLGQEGYAVESNGDGKAGLARAQAKAFAQSFLRGQPRKVATLASIARDKISQLRT